MRNHWRTWLGLSFGLWLLLPCVWTEAAEPPSSAMAKVDLYVTEAWRQSGIPGMALAVVDGPDVFIKGYGLASRENGTPVTPETLFEIGSCTKAFTGLAMAQLRAETGLDFNSPVAKYLPLFFGLFQGRQAQISLADLLYHTSGIPDNTIMHLPAGDQDYALTKTVLGLSGLGLGFAPGSQFAYVSANYDVAAQVLQVTSAMSYERYLEERVLKPLGLHDTLVGAQAQVAATHPRMASGYKVGFLEPRLYVSPVFRGNFPAGYVISNARDMARWLRLQLGLDDSPLSPLIHQAQEPNRKVEAGPSEYYALGWYVTERGLLHHTGANPTFTAFLVFDPALKKGLAVLSNYNSGLAEEIGWGALAVLQGRDEPPGRGQPGLPFVLDRYASIASLVLGLISLAAGLMVVLTLWRMLTGRRRFVAPGAGRLLVLGLSALLSPAVTSLAANLPALLLGGTWDALEVWGPISLPVAAGLLLAAWFMVLTAINLCLLFPRRPAGAKA